MLGGIDVEEDDVDQKLTKKTFFKENHHCFNNKMKSIIYEWCLSFFIWFSLECFLKCFFKTHPQEKALGHLLQGNGFSPECILMCFFKTTPCEKALGHWLQGYGFSPECVFKFPPFRNALGHWLQGNGFSSDCTLKCLFRCPTS